MATPQPSYVSTDSRLFLKSIAEKLGWNDLSDDIVMDRKPSENLLRVCRYRRLKWKEKISKVVSSHCFHQLKDQKIAFQNIFRMLKPGGEVAIFFCLKSGYVAWHCDLVNNSEWNRYYNGNSPEIPLTQFSNKEASEYETILKEIGFSIIECKKDRIGVPFESTEIWKNAIFNVALSSFAIPENSKERFKDDICKIFINQNAMLSDKPCTISYFLTVLLRKPAI
ncbi:uncharacterized protein CEXT_662451 [Caerostris extrusa]|uniref:Methyltransferase type 11 domain-containing protein n=1 Tax=Caerostris extrusa TaxID=172846 RepID=A0AAV4XDU6_CAEEX|nr:uncharacterized protein CEXT_662451 [Caerostris extrusa]